MRLVPLGPLVSRLSVIKMKKKKTNKKKKQKEGKKKKKKKKNTYRDAEEGARQHGKSVLSRSHTALLTSALTHAKSQRQPDTWSLRIAYVRSPPPTTFKVLFLS